MRSIHEHHHENIAPVQKETSNLNKIIENFQYNSLFSYAHIKTTSCEWQSYLEKILNFLTEHKEV